LQASQPKKVAERRQLNQAASSGMGSFTKAANQADFFNLLGLLETGSIFWYDYY